MSFLWPCKVGLQRRLLAWRLARILRYWCYFCGDARQNSDWYQSLLSNYDESTEKLNLSIYKVTFLLYQLLIFLNLFVEYLFRHRLQKKRNFYPWQLMTIFYFTRPVGRKQTTFQDWPQRKNNSHPNVLW